MILSDSGIKAALAAGDLEIDPPPDEGQFSTSALNLRLGKQFSGWDEKRLNIEGFRPELNLAKIRYQDIAQQYLVNLPLQSDGSFLFDPYRDVKSHVLAATLERVHLKRGSKLAARVEGRSSLARIGIVVHLTAPTVHAGFRGSITLEMINFGPFPLRMVPAQTQICQLIVERLETDYGSEIQTQFQDQNTPSGVKSK